MNSTRKKKNQEKRPLSQLNETLNDFVIGEITLMGVTENQNLEQQANSHLKDFERNVDHASQNQVIGYNTDDRIGNAVNNAVIAVKSRMLDAILTAMKDIVITRVEMAVKSITGCHSMLAKPAD